MDRDTADLRADQRGGDIKSGVDPETDLIKIKILQQGVTQMAHTDHNDAVAAVYTQDVADLRTQLGHIVAVALLAELTKAAQVLPDLGGGDVHLGAQRVGADTHHAFVVQIVQIPIVPGKTMNDSIGDFLLLHRKTFFCVECGAQRSMYCGYFTTSMRSCQLF